MSETGTLEAIFPLHQRREWSQIFSGTTKPISDKHRQPNSSHMVAQLYTSHIRDIPMAPTQHEPCGYQDHLRRSPDLHFSPARCFPRGECLGGRRRISGGAMGLRVTESQSPTNGVGRSWKSSAGGFSRWQSWTKWRGFSWNDHEMIMKWSWNVRPDTWKIARGKLNEDQYNQWGSKMVKMKKQDEEWSKHQHSGSTTILFFGVQGGHTIAKLVKKIKLTNVLD